MKIQNALVSNILDRSQRYFAHVTTVTLSWRVQNIVVIGRVYFTLDCFEFSSNFEFDRNMLSGTGARYHYLCKWNRQVVWTIFVWMSSLTIVASYWFHNQLLSHPIVTHKWLIRHKETLFWECIYFLQLCCARDNDTTKWNQHWVSFNSFQLYRMPHRST